MTIVERYNGYASPSDFGPAEITVSGIVNPNNGTLLLSDSTAKAFRLRRDGFVFAYGREEQRTVLKVDIGAIGDMLAAISNDTRRTLAIETNTTITVSASPAPGKIERIDILPTPETLEKLPPGLSLFDSVLKPYLSEHKPVLHQGDDLTVWHSEQQFYFKVCKMIVKPHDDPYGIITEETIVHCGDTTPDAAWVEDQPGPPEKSGQSSGLLRKGANPDANDRYGPAITQAIRQGFPGLAIKLLRNGANPDANDRYGPAITQAIRQGFEGLAIELLRKGANPNASDRYGPAITQAIRQGFLGLAIELLSKDANPDASDRDEPVITQAIELLRESPCQRQGSQPS
ncbi:AAA ATPase cdc48 [Fusarium solani]|nr:AAA ATPase cdc48 [Fusarium solani]